MGGGQILSRKPLFCQIYYLITAFSRSYSSFILYNHFFFGQGGGAYSIAKTDEGDDRICSPGSATD